MVPTASTTPAHEGLAAVVKTAAARPGEEQPPPTAKGEVLLTDKAAAENADRARFAFVGLENFIDVDELAMVAGSGTHVYKAKKSGKKCIGCPEGGCCGGSCGGHCGNHGKEP